MIIWILLIIQSKEPRRWDNIPFQLLQCNSYERHVHSFLPAKVAQLFPMASAIQNTSNKPTASADLSRPLKS
jgi:hypothetical protein